LLIHSLEYAWREREDFCVGGNQFVYYSAAQAEAIIQEVTADMGEDEAVPVGRRTYRGPDVFVVRGIDGSYPRQEWVVWMEGGRYPDLIIELLSPSTRAKDLGEKKLLYQDVFRTKEYFVFNPFEPYEFHGWRLMNSRYEPVEADGRGWRWSHVIECWLGTWHGMYDQERTSWLRFYDTDGQLVMTGLEAAEQRAEAAEQHVSVVEQRAEAEHQRAEAAEAELDRLRAQVKRGEDSPPG
jgi:Uma2 family endonuclease